MEAQTPGAAFCIQHKALPWLLGSRKSCGEELGQIEESGCGVGRDGTGKAPYVFSVSESKTSKDTRTNELIDMLQPQSARSECCVGLRPIGPFPPYWLETSCVLPSQIG